MRDFEEHLNNPLRAVNSAYYYKYEDEMNEHGLEKFALIINGLLFEIEHGTDDAEQAYEAS